MIANEPGSKQVLEQGKRLSESLVWGLQRAYFEGQGIEAWLHDVPFYITSNPFIANSYARLVIHFIRDWIAKHPEAKNNPFYVMELGTGPGRFSYYTVKALDELRRDFGMDDVRIIYVMSDFAQANLDYHNTHHTLVPYIEKGMLDLAIHDMDSQNPIKLMHSKIELNEKTLLNPICLFANYVFDTISNDAFCVQNGRIYELLVKLSTETSNVENGKAVDLSKIDVEYEPKEIHGSYYNDPALDQVLDLYRTELKDTSFLVPIGSIRGINYLKKLSNNKFFFISSDKAYSELASLENLGHPSMTFHGNCFSMMAKCHAIGQYFKNSGGDYYPQTTRRGLKTCVYSSGFSLSDLPETRVALKEYVENFSPSDFFNVYRHMMDSAETVEMDAIASYLEQSRWDPQMYSRISARILAIVNEADADTVNFVANNIHKVAENYYYMPKAECVLFEVGVFFHALKRYEEAIFYYRQVEKFLGEQFSLYYNTALCLHHLDQNQEALKYFRRSVELDQDSKEAKDWVAHLEKVFLEKKYEPKNVRHE